MIIKRIYFLFQFFGFDLIILFNSIRYLPNVLIQFFKFKKSLKNNSDSPVLFKPVLGQHKQSSGVMSGHYFHQDLLVARRIFEENPIRHVDIGSRTDGFVAHVASFREIEIFDIRQQVSNISNITFKQANLMELNPNLVNYADSLSALHSLEHFGLGRYGDPIDPDGFVDGIKNIHKILKKGGKFYFSVPIGKQRIEFNAHRVFSLDYLLDILRDKYKVNRFSYVNDQGLLFENITPTKNEISNNFGCQYGCGIFELTKL